LTQLTALDVAQLALQVGLPTDKVAVAVAIAWAESGLRTDAIGHNYAYPGGPITSTDRGLWQINDYYHPEVNNACAFDGVCNTSAMIRISSQGTNWSPWTTYANGAYLTFLAAATLATNLAIGKVQAALTPDPRSRADAAAADLRNGGNVWRVFTTLIQAIVNDVMNDRFAGSDAGPVFGGWLG